MPAIYLRLHYPNVAGAIVSYGGPVGSRQLTQALDNPSPVLSVCEHGAPSLRPIESVAKRHGVEHDVVERSVLEYR